MPTHAPCSCRDRTLDNPSVGRRLRGVPHARSPSSALRRLDGAAAGPAPGIAIQRDPQGPEPRSRLDCHLPVRRVPRAAHPVQGTAVRARSGSGAHGETRSRDDPGTLTVLQDDSGPIRTPSSRTQRLRSLAIDDAQDLLLYGVRDGRTGGPATRDRAERQRSDFPRRSGKLVGRRRRFVGRRRPRHPTCPRRQCWGGS